MCWRQILWYIPRVARLVSSCKGDASWIPANASEQWLKERWYNSMISKCCSNNCLWVINILRLRRLRLFDHCSPLLKGWLWCKAFDILSHHQVCNIYVFSDQKNNGLNMVHPHAMMDRDKDMNWIPRRRERMVKNKSVLFRLFACIGQVFCSMSS